MKEYLKDKEKGKNKSIDRYIHPSKLEVIEDLSQKVYKVKII